MSLISEFSMATCANAGGREAGHQNMKLDAGNTTRVEP